MADLGAVICHVQMHRSDIITEITIFTQTFNGDVVTFAEGLLFNVGC